MSKGRKKKSASNTAANQTRGLTDIQRTINKATGVDTNYNYNRGAAASSARAFAEQELKDALASGDKARIKKARDVLKRKSMGGSGG